MEKPYFYLALMMTVTMIMVFVVTAVLQITVATLAVIIFSFILLLFFIRDKAEKIELISFWFVIVMFVVTAATIFQKGGF